MSLTKSVFCSGSPAFSYKCGASFLITRVLNLQLEVNTSPEALLIPSPLYSPRCISVPMCVNSPRPENQRRNWQVKGALKVCGAPQNTSFWGFFSITVEDKEHHDISVWSKLCLFLIRVFVEIEKWYGFLFLVAFSRCCFTAYV